METTLEKAYKSSLKLLTPLTLEETYATIVTEAVKLVKAQHGSIMLERDGALYRAYTSHPPLYEMKIRPRGFNYKVFRSNKARIIPIKRIAKEVHPIIGSTKAESDLMIPLSYENKAIGVLTLLSKPKKEFTKKDMAIAKLFSPMATLAIKKAQALHETTTALETRDLFISMASHELKTPLTTIKAYTQLLHKKIQKNEDVNSKWVERLLNEVTRLTHLINELLQVNLIKMGHLHYVWKECGLKEITKRAITDFEIANPKYNITFENGLNSHNDVVWADYDKLIQVVANLLSNASKFSRKNSEIKVTLNYQDPFYTIAVTDKGKGIHKKDLRHIFDRFYRGVNDTYEGMGIGLYLTKEIVDRHNGKVEVQSEVNQGTTVFIKLPEMK